MLRRRYAGFSLVELLVVITVITILIALLMPSMRRVRALTQSVACLDNQHMMAKGFVMYGTDNNHVIFPLVHVYGEYWQSVLLPYFGGTKEVLLCPTANKFSYGRGTNVTAWGPGGGIFGDLAGSYGMNLWFLPKGVYATDGNMHQTGYWRNTRQDPASQIPVFGDSPWVGAWPDDQDLFPTDLVNGFVTHAKPYFMGRFCIDRHDMAINVAFLDGHATTVPLKGLWKLKWHKTYDTTVPEPP